ncbi:hypothetical protein [Mycobacterium shigaense]|uniref:Uncharacterized protein n=1 Tax=Mycobacterium shigaense TaxID=722731 RepID=A0A1Z4EGF6_9MYCO|nr:hypothetical protein [Mycobacterium shigaense]BAX92041.1 hypothetical protein MSG_01888 [Mycobacterium shigaense]
MNLKATEELPVEVVFPDVISGAVVPSSEWGPVGLFNVTSRGDVLRLAFLPQEVRMLAALWLNIADELDKFQAAQA